MSESFDKVLWRYYSEKMRAERDLAVQKRKNEMLFSLWQHIKAKQEEEHENNFLENIRQMIQAEHEQLYRRIQDETKNTMETRRDSIKNEIETLKENIVDKTNSLESNIDLLDIRMGDLKKNVGELKMKINSNLEEEKDEGNDGTDNTEDEEALPGLKYFKGE